MTCELPNQIAIDGPAASGKTTVGMAIAAKYGYLFLDTGLMYRAVTLAAMKQGIPARGRALGPFMKALDMDVRATSDGTEISLAGEDVTSRLSHPEVEHNVSRYAAVPLVRTAMVRQQRLIAATAPSILAGRDIGTVVLPAAPLKFYLVASETARAMRRASQAAQGASDARKDISSRDTTDSTRTTSPLMPAEDAIVIDTTELTLEEVVAFALERVACANG